MSSVFKFNKKIGVTLLILAFTNAQQAIAGAGNAMLGLVGAVLAVTPFAAAATGIVIASMKVHKARMTRKFYSTQDTDGNELPEDEKRLVTDPEECRIMRESQLIKWGIILGLSCAVFFPTLKLAVGGAVLGCVC